MGLAEIRSPEDIRSLSPKECEELAAEIRKKIVQTVSKNGGHLSSNLGTVELTMALHRVFHCPQDRIVFDVGHQAYTHKLLTGRYAAFDTLRKHGGLCGFPRKAESPCDSFETGHASTSVSAALGMARARDLQGENYHVVAVIGDGATTGGMCYEALNDGGSKKTRLIVVVNDNEMSIARNVGALSRYFSKLRSKSSYIRTKKYVKSGLRHIPVLGKPIYYVFHYIKTLFKRLFIGEGFFSTLGFHYIGPVDGHNISAMEKAFRQAATIDEPVLVHCLTTKGYGYAKAEDQPERFHGTQPFSMEGDEKIQDIHPSNGKLVNDCLVKEAEKHPSLCVITAAMAFGTGCSVFKQEYEDHFFDVGIAEEHAVTMAAGMAASGALPVVFVYSTFLQRAYDQVLHDVCMQNHHVVLMLDRAGFACDDGKTHHGIYDLSLLQAMPGMKIFSPACADELLDMTQAALSMPGAVAIRYPRSFSRPVPYEKASFRPGHWQLLREGNRATVLALGSMAADALALAERFGKNGLRVVNASSVKPLDDAFLSRLAAEGRPVFTLEEHSRLGGFGSSVLAWTEKKGVYMNVHCFGVGDTWIEHGSREELLKDAGLDTDTLEKQIRDCL